jgi:hypothetical protein
MVQILLGQTAAALLSAGLAVGGVQFVFTHPRRVLVDAPDDLRPHVEDVQLVAVDGARLHALWIRAAGEPSTRTILQHHGFNSAGGLLMDYETDPLMVWPLVRCARARGYNLLLVDVRAHGRSDGPWDMGGGSLLSDLVGWVRWLRREQGQLWVGLWGNSLGAAVGLILAARPTAGGLDALALDSMPISADGLYSGLYGRSAAIIIEPVVRRLSEEMRDRAFTDGRLPVKALGWAPILLVHGDGDRHVPVMHSQRAYDLLQQAGCDGNCELWVIPGADHLAGLGVVEEEYIERVVGWFDRWFDGDGSA